MISFRQCYVYLFGTERVSEYGNVIVHSLILPGTAKWSQKLWFIYVNTLPMGVQEHRQTSRQWLLRFVWNIVQKLFHVFPWRHGNTRNNFCTIFHTKRTHQQAFQFSTPSKLFSYVREGWCFCLRWLTATVLNIAHWLQAFWYTSTPQEQFTWFTFRRRLVLKLHRHSDSLILSDRGWVSLGIDNGT